MPLLVQLVRTVGAVENLAGNPHLPALHRLLLRLQFLNCATLWNHVDTVSTLRLSDFTGGTECNLNVTVFTTCSGDCKRCRVLESLS